MRTTISNASRGWAGRLAGGVVPALASLFVLLAVTAVPAVDLSQARAQRTQARQVASQRALEARQATILKSTQVLARIQASLAAARSGLPRSGSSVSVHGLVRTAARLAGVQIDGLSLGPVQDSRLGVVDDAIAERPVEVFGSGSPQAVLAVAAWLQAMNLPCAVRALSLERVGTSTQRYSFVLKLGLFHFSPPFTSGADQDSLPQSLPEIP